MAPVCIRVQIITISDSKRKNWELLCLTPKINVEIYSLWFLSPKFLKISECFTHDYGSRGIEFLTSGLSVFLHNISKTDAARNLILR